MSKMHYGDGSSITLGQGTTHPPGHDGQHGNVNRPWVQKDGGPWILIDTVRSSREIRELMSAAFSADDFLTAIGS
jgi:hypothetical protein